MGARLWRAPIPQGQAGARAERLLREGCGGRPKAGTALRRPRRRRDCRSASGARSSPTPPHGGGTPERNSRQKLIPCENWQLLPSVSRPLLKRHIPAVLSFPAIGKEESIPQMEGEEAHQKAGTNLGWEMLSHPDAAESNEKNQ